MVAPADESPSRLEAGLSSVAAVAAGTAPTDASTDDSLPDDLSSAGLLAAAASAVSAAGRASLADAGDRVDRLGPVEPVGPVGPVDPFAYPTLALPLATFFADAADPRTGAAATLDVLGPTLSRSAVAGA
jgi:hypothetical protein